MTLGSQFPFPALATSDLLSVTIVLPFLDAHIHVAVEHVVFWVWFLSLSTVLLRFVCFVVYFVFIAECSLHTYF